MDYERGFGFIGGFILGGLVGAAVALLLAPASGEATREQIREEGIALRNRGQELSEDAMRQAQNLVKQGQQGVAGAGARVGGAVNNQLGTSS